MGAGVVISPGGGGGGQLQDHEAVLVFGGIDPHGEYGRRGNTGRDVYGYEGPSGWRFVGEMPEPRHHHSVAYYAGRVYVAGELLMHRCCGLRLFHVFLLDSCHEEM